MNLSAKITHLRHLFSGRKKILKKILFLPLFFSIFLTGCALPYSSNPYKSKICYDRFFGKGNWKVTATEFRKHRDTHTTHHYYDNEPDDSYFI